jgi:alkylation response protein AidB-like acyl-CoA dehydrogenase
MSVNTPPRKDTTKKSSESFAETALKLGGKSDDEARRTGAIDRADDQVEELFKSQYQTINSPAHRAVWDRGVPVELFRSSGPVTTPPDVQRVMDQSVDFVRGQRESGQLLDSHGKIRDEVMVGLAERGYWGLLVDKEYGGSGTAFRSFAPFLTRMSMQDPTIAGLASVHGCIGAVDPVRTFGNAEQKSRFLPELASGRKLSAFALTEPCAGSDLTALKTRAVLNGDDYVVNGEKLFITNVVPGRTIGLVCLIDDQPSVLICDLPKQEDQHFQLRKYGLYALKQTFNQGIIFKDFRVPKENLLKVERGNGLTIAYHGLNLGRIALCANAAGVMRQMMASMVPWAQYRLTYGEKIAKRELVRRRLGKLAGMIVASDALVHWCSDLIDQGYRGEMECVVAKIFGSEFQKEAAIELCMKTHGGRSFLHGHMLGDNVHEFLAPCIYEGEGEMLGMAFFKSLVKHHGTQFFEPVGKALHTAGIKQMNPMNPLHLWALRGAMIPYAKWMIGRSLSRTPSPKLPSNMPAKLREHAEFACEQLQKSALETSGTMRKHQLKLADRQCRMSELSLRIQSLIVILATSLYAAEQSQLVQDAADAYCTSTISQYRGQRPSDKEYRAINKLGETIVDGGVQELANVPAHEVMMQY